MVLICKMKHYNIYSEHSGTYIVHNTHKEFSEGHTHINTFSTAKYVAYLSLYKRMPKNGHLSLYLIDSVIRISDDPKYIGQMKNLKEKELKKKGKK